MRFISIPDIKWVIPDKGMVWWLIKLKFPNAENHHLYDLNANNYCKEAAFASKHAIRLRNTFATELLVICQELDERDCEDAETQEPLYNTTCNKHFIQASFFQGRVISLGYDFELEENVQYVRVETIYGKYGEAEVEGKLEAFSHVNATFSHAVVVFSKHMVGV